MTSEQLELASLRRELGWLMQSEAIKSMSQKDENGKHKYNIKGLDDCIQTLHKRALSAESKLSAANTELMSLLAENVRLRRQIEAIADPPAMASPASGGGTAVNGGDEGVAPLPKGGCRQSRLGDTPLPNFEFHEPHPQDADPDGERRFPIYG